MANAKTLQTICDDKWLKAQFGKYLDERHYKLLIQESTNLLKPNGNPLLMFRKGALPEPVCELARPVLRKAGSIYTDHRGYHSNIIGNYFANGACRKTSYTRNNLKTWGNCLPFIRDCDDVFRAELPDRWQTQRAVAEHTDPRFVIGDTSFTTVTVNTWDDEHDARTPVHTDKGDLAEGFGVISVLSAGNYTGGYLVFPKYGVAVDMRTTDVLLCDVHEAHGNTAIVGEPGWQRIATVLYYRSKMRACPT